MTDTVKSGFTFYRSYVETARVLEDEDPQYAAEFYRAIIEYMFDGRDVSHELHPFVRIAFKSVQPSLDVSKRNSTRSAKNKTESKPNENQTKTESKPNENQNETESEQCPCPDTDTGPDTVPVPVPDTVPDTDANVKEAAAEVIEYLNAKTGKRFNPRAQTSIKHVIARMHDGASVADCKHVIDVKCASWLNNRDMNRYLNPETLFRPSKFANYLNESIGPPGRISQHMASVFDDFDCSAEVI